MSYLKDREIWLSSVPTGNPPAGYVWVFIQNGVFVVRDSSGVDKIMATTTGTVTNAASASYVEYSNVANKPALISGSSQVSYTGLSNIPAGIVSGSAQIVGYNVFATTGSNQFNGSQAVTGSLTVTGQVVAQTLNVQQVTSSIVYSSGSNIFGNSLSNTQQFTGSLQVSGSSHYVLGSVGIGTTSPTQALEVNGTGLFTGTSLTNNTRSGVYILDQQIYSLAGGNSRPLNIQAETLAFFTGTSYTQRMLINSSGHIGIGVTPSAWDNTIIRGLQIGTVRPAFLIGRTDTISQVQLGVNAYYDGNWKYFATGEANRYYQGAGEHVWERAISGNANANITWLPQMIITAGDNVGIGVTSPGYRLVVNSATDGISAGVSGNTYGIRFDNGGTFSSGMSTIHGVDNTLVGSYQPIMLNGSDVRFGTSATERMRITSGGNVLIGTTTASALLEVKQPTLAIGSIFQAWAPGVAGANFRVISTTGQPYMQYDFNNGSVTVGGGVRFSSSGADANRWGVFWNGTTGDLIVVNNQSDIRLKKDFDYNIKGLETIQKLKPLKFTWKDGTSHSTSVSGRLRQYGFIAQETMEADDYLAWHNQSQDTWGIEQYESFSAVIVKAIQELKSENDNLKSRLEVLEQA